MTQTQTRFTTQGLVIKEMIVGESDRLVTLFTSEFGIIKAFASGAKTIKSKKGTATSLLTYSSFTILRKKESLRIYEATPITTFFEIGADIEILSLAQYFCELASEFSVDGTSNKELFRLILNSLHFLTKEKRFPALIKSITELRTAVISGYSPNLIACEECGMFEDDVMYFNIDEGSLVCKNCKRGSGCYAINKTMLSALRHIVYSEFKNLYSFNIPEESAKLLSDITGKYITVQTEHKFSTLEFFNSIKE